MVKVLMVYELMDFNVLLEQVLIQVLAMVQVQVEVLVVAQVLEQVEVLVVAQVLAMVLVVVRVIRQVLIIKYPLIILEFLKQHDLQD